MSQTETNIKTSKTQNEAEGSTIINSQPNGRFDFKNDAIRHSWSFKKTIIREIKQLKKETSNASQDQIGKRLLTKKKSVLF